MRHANISRVTDEREVKRIVRRRAAGSWLRQQRERAGLSQEDLSRLLGVRAQQVSNYERGLTALDDEESDQRARRISDALHIPLLDVRRHLGMWVPSEDDTQPPKVIEAINADPTLDPDMRVWLLDQYDIAQEMTRRRAAEDATER